MIFKWLKNISVYVIAFSFFIEACSSSSSKCDMVVNNQNYLGQKLYSTKNYDIKFGLPLKNKESEPIGYSIGIKCVPTNITKLNTTLSFDVQNIPIEINYIYCDNVQPIKKLNFSNKERNQLNFWTEFTLMKNIFNTEINMNLKISTR